MDTPKVNFKYNLKKDAWSWVLIAKDKNLWGLNWKDQVAHIPEGLLKEILKSSRSGAQKKVERFLRAQPIRKYKQMVREKETEAIKAIWSGVEKTFFKKLSLLTQKPIFTNKFDCYFTTGLMCPYNEKENWFMVSMWASIPISITIICHEIMHLQFLHDYKKYLIKKGLKKEQIEDLKEAMTILLNGKEFEEIILCDDSGYPKHQKLRKKLQKIWAREKDFQKFLDEAILEVKNIGKC